ncbi:RbsD/FucU family protein [Acetivibrio cellulolyticus]|uniref:RbsD/FucU family protein n=1 Tax=Acetivibrio cellulolyticus TaxID=35830 RepID=UPI0001E2F151|nr:RbsD/FucU domain-containing protein [Acetivibrio cellulolyticus]
MLKGIPSIISPELLKILCEMGHGDCIVLADGNFPAESVGRDSLVIRADGHGVIDILDAVLKVFPLDTYVEQPIQLMQAGPQDDPIQPIWSEIETVVAAHDDRAKSAIGFIERFSFYDTAKKAYCIVATGERAIYANAILKKGVIAPE